MFFNLLTNRSFNKLLICFNYAWNTNINSIMVHVPLYSLKVCFTKEYRRNQQDAAVFQASRHRWTHLFNMTRSPFDFFLLFCSTWDELHLDSVAGLENDRLKRFIMSLTRRHKLCLSADAEERQKPTFLTLACTQTHPVAKKVTQPCIPTIYLPRACLFLSRSDTHMHAQI